MCAAMLLYNQIHTVFYGCANDRFGGTGSILSMDHAELNYLHYSTTCNGDNSKYNEHVNRSYGYRCEGGHRAKEAVALLQLFYKRENPNAPGHKRRRKPSCMLDEMTSIL